MKDYPEKKGHLLVVDDSITTIQYIMMVLAEEGYEIDSATTGQMALEMIPHRQPDLILLDILMPDMDGYEVCRRLSDEHGELNQRVIFMSSLSDAFDKVKAFELGAVDYVTKPISSEELRARVRTHMVTSRLHKHLADEVARQTAELKKSELRYQALFESSNDAILVNGIDEQGRVCEFTDVNGVACQWLGYKRRELLAKRPQDIMPAGEDNQLDSIFQRLLDQKTDVFEYTMHTKDAGDLQVEISSRLFERDGRRQVISILRDISERKRVQDALQRSEQQLRQAQKMEAMGTLAGGIAHDFNNILGGIIGYADLISYYVATDEKLSKYVDQIMKASERAKELVQQILAFSRQGEHKKRPLEMHPIVKEALKLLRASIPSSIEIQTDINPNAGTILADATQIHQVMMNLCTNAYHAMLEGDGILKVSLDSKTIFVRDDPSGVAAGAYVLLKVSDSGCGMSKTTIERIFDPYFTTKEKDKGTGLGLAVVHGIVKSHDGYITVDSVPQEGSTFTIYLPVIEQPQIAPGNFASMEVPTGDEHILLIDDEEMLLLTLEAILKTLGYRVTTYSSPVNAFTAFSASPQLFDGIVTDMTMPAMNGLEVAQRMLEVRKDIPIIITTGYSELISKERADAVGIRAVVMKPFVRQKIAVILRQALDASETGHM